MAKRSRPPPTGFETLAELGWKTFEEARNRRFAEWNSILKEKPNTRELRRICLLQMINPDLIGGPYAPHNYLILQRWLATTRLPKHPFSAKEIAEFVDLVIDTETPPSKAQAYQKVAEAFEMTVEAVKQAHLRHGKRKRDKSR
jgi:hypothetical protein